MASDTEDFDTLAEVTDETDETASSSTTSVAAMGDKTKAITPSSTPTLANTKITFKTFDNKDPKLSGHLWMWQTEGIIQQYSLTDKQALAQVRTALVGDPGRWFSCVLQDEDNKETQVEDWATFKEAFRKRYMQTDNFTQQLKMFQSCKQRQEESVASFHDRCVQITKRMMSGTKASLPAKNEKDKPSSTTMWTKEGIDMAQDIYQRMLFIAGLHEDLRLHMEEQAKPSDKLPDILEKAEKYERAQINTMPQLAATTDVATLGQRPHKFPGKPSVIYVDGVRKVLCLKCGNYGHMQYTCQNAEVPPTRQFNGTRAQTNRMGTRPQYQQNTRPQQTYNRSQNYRGQQQQQRVRTGRSDRMANQRYRAAAITDEEVMTIQENIPSEN